MALARFLGQAVDDFAEGAAALRRTWSLETSGRWLIRDRHGGTPIGGGAPVNRSWTGGSFKPTLDVGR
jgi:hypothetical protein